MPRVLVALSFARVACAAALASAIMPLPLTESMIPFTFEGATYQTYTKVVGDLSSSQSPLVVLHGGPGLSHDYLLPLMDLTAGSGTPIIFYDQIGNSRSTHLDSAPSTFWTIDLFVAELQNVVNYFKVGNSFNVLGHNWGGVLGAEFTVRAEPAGLKHLVLSSAHSSEALCTESYMQIVRSFPDNVQQGIEAGMAQPDRFKAALETIYAVHGCTVVPVPQDLAFSFNQSFADPTVASAPITTANWTIIDRLDRINVPTLVINGRNDIIQDFVVQPFMDGIVQATRFRFENSSHMPFYEERESYMSVVGNFLQ